MRKLRRQVAGARLRPRHRRRHPRRTLPGCCRPTATRYLTRGTWEEPRIFAEIQAAGAVADDEMEQVFNLGLGMLAVVAAADRLDTLDAVRSAGHDAWLVGEIVGRAWQRDDQPMSRNGHTGPARTEAVTLHIRD